jgi:hypothetical protein
MSKLVVSEQDLEGLDLKQFHEVLLVRSSDDDGGVHIFTWPRMAQFVSPLTESPLSNSNQLLVVVENPDDPETVARIKAMVIPPR